MDSSISASGSSSVTSPNSLGFKLNSSTRKAFVEGGHHLEKLEFALAVAETRGEEIRAALLRDQIAALGGNTEEPGT